MNQNQVEQDEQDCIPIYCPECGAESTYSSMGNLGRYNWYRCPDCGWEFSRRWEGLIENPDTMRHA